MLDAAALAAILDPERKVPGWWFLGCLKCRPKMQTCFHGDFGWKYIGPPDLHTAREHAWRMEDWLVKRGYQITMFKDTAVQLRTKCSIHDPISRNKNHTAALVAAIERIANG